MMPPFRQTGSDPLPYARRPDHPGGAPTGSSDCLGGGLRFYSDTLGLPDQAFGLLRDLIHERTGVYFEDSKRDLLADKLSARVVERGFNSFLDYYYLLKYDAAAEEEWPRVMDALAVPETYFWREVDQVRALVERLVPEHFQRSPNEPFRIWSAACCSGEEPLTILMLLAEAGWLERAPIEVTATDASPALVARARRGLYRERSFRALPAGLRAKYFRPADGGWQVDAALLARVRFGTVNLLDAAVAEYARVHVIFCRNVFIYFSADAVRRVVRRFAEGLLPPGYLFVGASESLLKLTDDFDLVELAGAFAYVKRALAGENKMRTPPHLHGESHPPPKASQGGRIGDHIP